MKKTAKISLIAALVGVLLTPSFAVNAQTAQVAQAAEFTTTATGYKKASDVKYNESGTYIANWGARGEDCVFLSKYAESFYTGSYVYDTLSKQSGGSTQSNASGSALYKSLQTLMKSKHTYETTYDDTRPMYRYTDCVSNSTSQISSFYSGKVLNGTWDSGDTWNREHTWPQSKSLNGSTKGKTGDEADIMMLRPTWVQENSSRGNTAYGEGSVYYDPLDRNNLNNVIDSNDPIPNVRGDCARIFLYVYVRWGNTQYAWGTSGVMESMSVLLKWMEEDPVDTWEMGRNDVVEDITGTRNVFVDYPEYAWLLFGKDIPDDMPTPSGKANEDISKPDDTPSGGNSSSDSDKPSTNEPPQSGDETSGDSSSTGCEHEFSDWITILKPTLDKDGKRMRTCYQCGESQTEVIPKCEHEFSDWIVIKEPTENKDGKRMRTCYKCGESVTGVLPKTGGCNGSVSGIAACSALLIAAGAAWFVNKRKEQ